MDFLTTQEVIAIYAEYGIKITAEEAQEDLEHMRGFAISVVHATDLIHGYALQTKADREGDGKEAADFERDR